MKKRISFKSGLVIIFISFVVIYMMVGFFLTYYINEQSRKAINVFLKRNNINSIYLKYNVSVNLLSHLLNKEEPLIKYKNFIVETSKFKFISNIIDLYKFDVDYINLKPENYQLLELRFPRYMKLYLNGASFINRKGHLLFNAYLDYYYNPYTQNMKIKDFHAKVATDFSFKLIADFKLYDLNKSLNLLFRTPLKELVSRVQLKEIILDFKSLEFMKKLPIEVKDRLYKNIKSILVLLGGNDFNFRILDDFFNQKISAIRIIIKSEDYVLLSIVNLLKNKINNKKLFKVKIEKI